MSRWAFDGNVLSSLKKLEVALSALANRTVVSRFEKPTPETWVDSQVYQKLFTVLSLPNTTTLSIEHGLTSFDIVGIEAIARSGTDWLPLPYVDTSALGSQIEISVDTENINITTGSDRTSLSAQVLLKYSKGR